MVLANMNNLELGEFQRMFAHCMPVEERACSNLAVLAGVRLDPYQLMIKQWQIVWQKLWQQSLLQRIHANTKER